MERISKKLTGKKIREEMQKRKLTVRDLQEILELDSPQSVYKWMNGRSLPSLQNMLTLGELFEVPLEMLLIHEDGTSAFRRIFAGKLLPYFGFIFQETSQADFKRRLCRSVRAVRNTLIENASSAPQTHSHQEVFRN